MRVSYRAIGPQCPQLEPFLEKLGHGSILGRRKEAAMKLKLRMTFTGKPIG
jgi:hypothetical protein